MDDEKQNSKRWGIVTLVVGILATIIVLELLQMGGNTRFYTTWLYCEQKPVAAESLNARGNVIYYYEPSSWPGIHAAGSYYCTPLEAETAGYSASPTQYEFPNLQRGA